MAFLTPTTSGTRLGNELILAGVHVPPIVVMDREGLVDGRNGGPGTVARDGRLARCSRTLLTGEGRAVMVHAGRERRRGVVLALWPCLLLAGLMWLMPSALSAVAPGNPRVEAAVDKALAFLDKHDDARLGGKALIGLAFAKHGEPETHPKIAAAVQAIQAALSNGPERFSPGIYDTGICIMFLVAVDPSKYRYEIESLVRSLHLRQKSDGAWGYPPEHPDHGQTCDTSMTQYAVLGLWEAEDQAGVETPRVVWDRVARWLLLTQDPSGGYGYQGKPASRLGRSETQAGVRDSMTVAAVGALYIVKDRVGITQLKKPSIDDTPDAFVPYETPEEREERLRTTISLRHFARALASGNRWIEDKLNVEKIAGYVHYCLYSLERFESLREADLAGRSDPAEKSEKSKWYNRGVRFLLPTQKPDGSWESQCGVVPDTCFAALFLMGSTRKSLAKSSLAHFTADTLIGGQGLPAAANVRVRAGQVVVQPLAAPLNQVLVILADRSHPDYMRAVESLADAVRQESADQLAAHADALVTLATGGDRSVRLLAIQGVGRTGQLDHVPWLIRALSDTDDEIALAAAESLAELSRKYDTRGFDRQATQREREVAIDQWKAWFRSIRPDVDLSAR